MGKEKITLFLDVDDTVLHSSEAVVQIMNEKYGTNKTVQDVTDWGYRSIYSGANFDNVNEIFSSERFWNIVQIDPDFERFYHDHKRHFNFVFVSKGVPLNLKRKEAFLKKHFSKATFLPCALSKEVNCYDKSHINMTNGIQIDDRFDALETTNANCKILYKRGTDRQWNKQTAVLDNLYIVDTWKEIIKILEFALVEEELMRVDTYEKY